MQNQMLVRDIDTLKFNILLLTNTYNIAFIQFRIIRYMKINLSKGMSEFNGNCCINKHPNPLQL